MRAVGNRLAAGLVLVSFYFFNKRVAKGLCVTRDKG